MPNTTRQLLRNAATAPREGFAALHQRAAADLFLWAGLHVQPTLRRWLPLEDFVQEVWARAYTCFATFDPTRDFRAWLFGIALNVLREQLRSLRVRQRAGTPPLAEEPAAQVEVAAPGTSVVSAAARNETTARVLAAVDQLRADQRELVLWRWLEELPFAEIGRRLSISALAVESRWRRVLLRLAVMLPADALRRA